jgi:hypothetical protein
VARKRFTKSTPGSMRAEEFPGPRDPGKETAGAPAIPAFLKRSQS